jgi:dTDP-4-dehydrorhamnose reductase
MKLLITGSHGQLGWELCRRGERQGFDIVPLDIPDFDITDRYAVDHAVNQTGLSLVINAAAYTAVDLAESEPDRAFKVNRDGPAFLASSCADAGIPLIHISTDYVFDGSKKGPYVETDPVCPLGVYGQSKAAGESEVRERLPLHIILRSSWLYSVHGQNFVKTMLHLGKEREIVRVVSDQYGCPTYAADLAEGILSMAYRLGQGNSNYWGTYHFCGSGETTWHGFAERIFELAREYDSFVVKKVVPITTPEYPTPARRPSNSVLACSLLCKTFDIIPRPWQESLARAVQDLYESNRV